MRHKTLLLGSCLLAARLSAATDPCETSPNFDSWAQCRLVKAINASSAQRTQSNPTKQTDGPAISSSSTSLVDHTSLADFATAAVNVAGFGNGSSQTPAATTTVSAYALYSAINGQNPLDPEFYNSHAGWRQVTFTVGTDAPATDSSTTTAKAAPTSTGSSRVVGASYLIVNERDLAKRAGDIANAALKAADWTTMDSKFKSAIEDKLYNAYAARLGPAPAGEIALVWAKNKLTTDKDATGHLAFIGWIEADSGTFSDIQALVNQYVPAYEEETSDVKNLVQKIQNAFQFSISGQATIGDTQMQNSDYRAQIALEKGAGAHYNFTLNGSFDYINSHVVGADTRGGRVATDFQYLFSSNANKNPKTNLSGKTPISLDLNGEADWFQSFHPSYVGQVKLTIPLVTGVDLPLSFSYASSTNLLHEEHSVGKFGLTFDLSKIASALSKH